MLSVGLSFGLRRTFLMQQRDLMNTDKNRAERLYFRLLPLFRKYRLEEYIRRALMFGGVLL